MKKLELYYPVKPLHFNQNFGQNLNPAYAAQGMKGHNGIDFMAKHGQPIYASHDGTCYPEIDNAGGNGVVIYSDDVYEFEGKEVHFKTIYWHLIDDDAVVHTGQHVKAGDLIGYADSTGVSTGDHLHYGLKPCAQGEADFAWYNVKQNNGYFGAIDPVPYFNGKFAEDINGASAPIFLFTKTLKFKMFNSDVKKLQEILAKIGYDNVVGKADGVFGPKTLEAVKQFQGKNGLDVDGIVGPKTQAVLTKLMA